MELKSKLGNILMYIGIIVLCVVCIFILDNYLLCILLLVPVALVFYYLGVFIESIKEDIEYGFKWHAIIKVVCITLAIIAIIALIVVCCNSCDSGSGHVDTSICKSCGRTFEAGDSAGNYKNIARSGMCNNCYNNYKSFEDLVD